MANLFVPKLKDDEYFHSYKVKLVPNKYQKSTLNNFIYIFRKIYNWTLEILLDKKEMYDLGFEDSAYVKDIEHMFIEARKSEEYKYFQQIPSDTGRKAVRRAEYAYDMYIRGKFNKPKFKSRKRDMKQSFDSTANKLYIYNDKVKIPGFFRKETINLDRNIELLIDKNSKKSIYGATISKDYDNNFWLTFSVIEKKKNNYFKENNIKSCNRYIGFDQNARDDRRIVLSDGTIYEFPDTSRIKEAIRRQNRKCKKDRDRLNKIKEAISKPNVDVQPSIRSYKRKKRLQKLETKLKNIRKNYIETTTKKIINKYPLGIAGESLCVNDMNRNKIFSKFTHDAGFADFSAALERKCNIYNIPFVKVDRYFKSTQTCSQCGFIKKMYGNRMYICPNCGLKIDRDLNSAINIEHEAFGVI